METLDEFRRTTESKLAAVRCPVHAQPPRLEFEGSTLREVTIRIRGCCPVLSELANRAVAQPLQRRS